MKKKRIVIALGHEALGTTLPEQQAATRRTAKAVADFIREDYQVVITHSNGPQVGMIHTAMSEFCRIYPESHGAFEPRHLQTGFYHFDTGHGRPL